MMSVLLKVEISNGSHIAQRDIPESWNTHLDINNSMMSFYSIENFGTNKTPKFFVFLG